MEHKFKVWECVQKVMLTDGFALDAVGRVSFYWNKLPIHSANAILIQSSGRMDKENVEIWNGDIITMKSYSYQHLSGLKWEVRYSKIEMMFRFYCISNPKYSDEDIHGFYDLEVLGNIYEHPHLLTDKTTNP